MKIEINLNEEAMFTIGFVAFMALIIVAVIFGGG